MKLIALKRTKFATYFRKYSSPAYLTDQYHIMIINIIKIFRTISAGKISRWVYRYSLLLDLPESPAASKFFHIVTSQGMDAENMFLTIFIHPNLRTLNTYTLASFGFGFSRSKIPTNDKKILHTPKARVGEVLLDQIHKNAFKWKHFIHVCSFLC